MTAMAASVCSRFGVFELRPRERLLRARGQEVHLGPRAFDVLIVLVERSGQLVTKEELFQRVWPRVIVEENTLQVHVSALRKVLGAEAIATVSGHGYRFTPQVTHLGATATDPISTPANNLPYALTSFIGREKEISDLSQWLGSARLITLTGSGGCGKTRLAIELARRRAHAYPDGAWLVELGALTDGALLPQTVSSVLGLKERPGEKLIDTIGKHLASRALLLVLDNAEHLLEACAQLAESLLRRCARLVVLVTTREPLSITGELIYRVPSLSVPDEDDNSAESIAAHESARLFIERARLQQPQFAITTQNSAAIAAICRRLDGIALALELAAPRLRNGSVEELSRRLDRCFEVLAEGSRTALPRHRTLRALIDWSYDLLDDAEQAMLRRVSVFSGGWTLEAAEQVCNGEGVDAGSALDLLTSLADKNLLLTEKRGHATRYAILETVRQYARDRLREHGEEVEIDRRHLAHLLVMTDEVRSRNMGASHDWLDGLEGELDNMRSALSSACGPDGDASGGLRLAGALHWLWQVRGYFSEGRIWLERLLPLVPEGTDDAVRAIALRVASVLALLQDDDAVAESLAHQTLALCTKLGDRSGIAMSLQALAGAHEHRGEFAAARALLEEGLAIRREIGDRAGAAGQLCSLGAVHLVAGDLAGARATLEESGAMFRELADWRVSYPLAMLGLALFYAREYAPAKARLSEALQIQRDVRIPASAASSLTTLGMVAHDEGDDEGATALLREALTILRHVDSPGYVCETLEAFAAVASAVWGTDEAARIWGAAERLREEHVPAPAMSLRRRWNDAEVAAARLRSGDGAFASAWNEGRAMSAEEAVAYALRVGSP